MINLTEKRKSKNMSQEELAEKVGVIRQTISNIECGIAKPSVDTAKKIGEVLGFEWTDFFND